MKQRIELMKKLKFTGNIYETLELNIYPETYPKNLIYKDCQSTLKIIFGSFKNPLPIHTLHYYVKSLLNRISTYNIQPHKSFICYDLRTNLYQMQNIIESYLTKDYWKKPEIKQPILVKLSKSDFNAIYK